MDTEMKMKRESDGELDVGYTTLQPTDLGYRLKREPTHEPAGDQKSDTEADIKREKTDTDAGCAGPARLYYLVPRTTRELSQEETAESTAKTSHSSPDTSRPLTENKVMQHSNIQRTPHVCSECGKMFRNRFSLSGHYGSHEKRYECNNCKETFCSITSLARHEFTHAPQKLFQCPTCDRSFDNRYSLSAHSRCHKDRKRYDCKDCNKLFSSPLKLDQHILTHSLEPYKCSNCGKTFTESALFEAHCKTHKAERSHECVYCKRKYFKSRDLTRHLLKHVDLKGPRMGAAPHSRRVACAQCELTFANRVALMNHIHTHTSPV